MADGKELKPKSFRITDETAEKLKEIAATIGGNQQEVLAKLIETYELQTSKNVLSDKSAEIEQFERYITAISRMYMANLEDNQNITKTVQAEFDALLRSKDTTIQDLQEQLTVAKQLKEESGERVKAYADENDRLSNNIDKLTREHDAKLNSMQAEAMERQKELAQIALDKALIEAKRKYQEQIQGLKDEKQAEVDKYQQKYLELLEQINKSQ